MKTTVIIVAGGSGKRMGGELPKQFIELQGRPILMHTLERFEGYDIILALPEEHIARWKELCIKHSFTLPHSIVAGGKERYFSVLNALSAVKPETDIVAIHDGVRPLIDHETIERCIKGAEEYGAIVPCTTLTDSIREIKGETSRAVDRSTLRAVQTPQCFRREIIMKAYSQDFNPTFTDDASVVESAGYEITMVEGKRENIKITTPVDLEIAQRLLLC